jgi:hypothetical protein
MKKLSLNLLGIQLLMFILLLMIPVQFQSCKPGDRDECDTCITVYKPNIYLYPTTKTPVKVFLSFPEGGKIITSIPSYGNGWDIIADTDGVINGRYEYLFYESLQPDVWQNTEGWTILKSDLPGFFNADMKQRGFRDKEIEDFTDYWIPRLTDSEYYIIYPQDAGIIEKVIGLDFSVMPDNVLRFFYLIEKTGEPVNNKVTAPGPVVKAGRTGFNVAEWGVILK